MNASHHFHVRTDTPVKAVTLPDCFGGINVEIGDGLYLHLTTEAAEALQATINGALLRASAIREAATRLAKEAEEDQPELEEAA